VNYLQALAQVVRGPVFFTIRSSAVLKSGHLLLSDMGC